MATHYEVLGVTADADTETIRRAYVALAKSTHPDRRQADDPALRSRAEEQIRAANVAWNVLRDPGRRTDYDRSLRPPSARPGGATSSSSTSPSAPASGGPADRPPPPSGLVVRADHATLWRFAPIVVVLVVLVGLLVVSAYATSNDTSAPAEAPTRASIPLVDECVLIVSVSGGRSPVPAACGTQGAYRVQSTVDSPRPCASGTVPLTLADQKTTLCLVPAT